MRLRNTAGEGHAGIEADKLSALHVLAKAHDAALHFVTSVSAPGARDWHGRAEGGEAVSEHTAGADRHERQ
jgi:hypothetical protein